jgi:hypothetical protein
VYEAKISVAPAKQIRNRLCGHRWTAEKALDHFAAIVTQPVGGFGVLDALCNCRHAELMRKVDHGADDGRGSPVDEYRCDELAVELDLVDGQVAQV